MRKIEVDNDGKKELVEPGALAGVGLGLVEILTAARVLVAADSGKTFYLALAGGFTVTLPVPTLGFKAKFLVKVAPTTAYIIAADASNQDSIAGSVLSSSGAAEDTEGAATADQINFVANTALIGDRCEVESDGTKWYGYAICSGAGGVTFTG